MPCWPPLSGYSPSHHFFIWLTALFWRDVHPTATGDLFLDVSLVPQQHEPSTYSVSLPFPGYWRGLLAALLVFRTALSNKASSMGMWEGSFQSSHLIMSSEIFQMILPEEWAWCTQLFHECVSPLHLFFSGHNLSPPHQQQILSQTELLHCSMKTVLRQASCQHVLLQGWRSPSGE